MKIESVDFFYLALPHIRDIGDGSQDALLVRVRAGGLEGWGECEASPLVSIAAYVTPMSHSACKSVGSQLEGESVDSPADILRIRRKVQANCLDLLQAPHTLSGIDIALWDLLGKKEQAPVYSLLGYDRALPKTAYASMLFGETPEQTQANVAEAVRRGFRAVKLGWGGYGSDLETDIAHLELARKEAGRDVLLMVDAGTVWTQAEDPVQEAARRLPSLKAAGVLWLEEPFSSYDFDYYSRLAELAGPVNLAGGEGAHNPEMAKHMMRYASLGFVQIDTGRIGGITAAHDVARACMQQHVRYVTHLYDPACPERLHPAFCRHGGQHAVRIPVPAERPFAGSDGTAHAARWQRDHLPAGSSRSGRRPACRGHQEISAYGRNERRRKEHLYITGHLDSVVKLCLPTKICI